MYEVRTFYDPFLKRRVNWSTWRPEPAAVVPVYVDRHVAWRPVQQRPRDGCHAVRKTGIQERP